MNKRQQSVMTKLKPKVKAFGFNQKELKSIAAQIADNLTSADDASDEDVNAEIDTAIEAVLPILKLGQAYANRVINANRNEDEDNDGDGEEEGNEPTSKPKPNKPSKPKDEKPEEIPAWAQAIIDSNKSLSEQFAALKGEKLTDHRRSRLEKLLKDTGAFGTRTLKSFAKMKFDNDEDFDEFYTEVEEDLKSLNQERANAGLAKLGAPATGGSGKKDEKPEVLSEDEIKAIAKM